MSNYSKELIKKVKNDTPVLWEEAFKNKAGYNYIAYVMIKVLFLLLGVSGIWSIFYIKEDAGAIILGFVVFLISFGMIVITWFTSWGYSCVYNNTSDEEVYKVYMRYLNKKEEKEAKHDK